MKTGIEPRVLEVSDLGFAYEKGVDILKGLSFSLNAGENIGLIGANGTGKSTLLKLLVGLEPGFDGSIIVAGHVMGHDDLAHIREHIGYVFQDSDNQLFMSTVEEDVAFGPGNYGMDENEVQERVTLALRRVHIEELRKKHIYKLSGGEKKLAAIATILVMEPDLILMDEPSVALDPKNRRNLIAILNDIPSTKLIASHDLDFIEKTCERVILMHEGRICADGPVSDILHDTKLLEECDL